MTEYHMDSGDAGFGWYTSKTGTIHKLTKKGSDQYHQEYFDNNRLWEGIDYSMDEPQQKKQKNQKSVYDYVGETVKSADDVGEVVEVVKNKNNKLYAKIKWTKPVSTYKSGEKNYFTKTPVANITKYLNENK